MAKKQFTNSIASIVSQTAAVESRFGLRLSDVVQEPLEKLLSNPLNEQLFDREDTVHFERLLADIQERGILVPLIAKPNGILLAGHNRFQVAKQIGLQVVPVQYVEDTLSAEAERKFVINDNLLRRQLTSEQRIKLYRMLYPNFDTRIRSAAGRPQKNDNNHHKKNNVDTVHISDDASPLTAADIAKDTGQSVAAVQKQLQRERKEQRQQKTSKQEVKSQTQVIETDGVNSIILKKAEKGLKLIEMASEEANEATRKMVLKKLKAFIKKFS
jgi:ParB-like chromosome segregation protein Spo0J